MWWSVLLGAACALIVESAIAAFIVRRKHLDRWLVSHLFGMDLCPRLNHPDPTLSLAAPAVPTPLVRPTVREQALPRVAVSDVEESLQHQPAAALRAGFWNGALSGHQTPHSRFVNDEPLHVFIAVCDHFEPDNARPARHVADARVDRWCHEYPSWFGCFEDTRGRHPQHSFFFPQDEYFVPGYLDQLKTLCEQGFGDVEIHLHHDQDTADGLREKLISFRDTLHHRHGLLRRDPLTNQITYGFIHGNWALCNAREDGRWCGVNDELTILRETGCYADFTMPSAPEATQTRIINSVYYAGSNPAEPRGHDRGTNATLNVKPPRDQLLLVQGPLTLDWDGRQASLVPAPRIENGDLLGNRPASWERFEQWLKCGVHVAGRPDWCFIKLHTHGCKDSNINSLLGEDTAAFHRSLRAYAARHLNFHYYYVTAREMAEFVHQAEQGRALPEWGA